MTVTTVHLCRDIQAKCLTLIVEITNDVTTRGGWKPGEETLYENAVRLAEDIALQFCHVSHQVKSIGTVRSYLVKSVHALPMLD